jgi:iron complex outermembrane receptor protein
VPPADARRKLQKPGITSSGFAPGSASRPIVRGLDNYRVRIQENGLSASGVSELGEDHAVPIDPLAAQTVEVIRGPATLRYGSQAIGGVVTENNAFRASRNVARRSAAPSPASIGPRRRRSMPAAICHPCRCRHLRAAAIPSYPYLYPELPAPLILWQRIPRTSTSSVGSSMYSIRLHQ